MDNMEDADSLTTYCFRRWAPTFGQALGLTPMELNALGDWQAKGETPPDAVIPLHYSSAKYAESLKMKHLLLLCSPSIGEFEAWEVIPPSTLREAKVQGRQALDKQIHRDAQTVWAQPISPGEALTKFRLSKNMMSTVANLKLKAAKAAEARAMPATLGNKVLSAFLKNGQALCGAFQIHRCGKEEAQCGALHRCAVVLRSARVCGGKHSACDCYDKRALAAGDTETPKKEETEAPQTKEERPPQPKKRPKVLHQRRKLVVNNLCRTREMRPSSTGWPLPKGAPPKNQPWFCNTPMEESCGCRAFRLWLRWRRFRQLAFRWCAFRNRLNVEEEYNFQGPNARLWLPRTRPIEMLNGKKCGHCFAKPTLVERLH